MPAREPVRFLVFSVSLRAESDNTRLAANTLERHCGTVNFATMQDLDAPSFD